MALRRRKFMRLTASGLSSALIPLSSCVQSTDKRGTTHFPTPDEPLTPTDAWFFMAVQGAYEADRASYRLKVAGLVDRSLSLHVDELAGDFPAAIEPIALSCVGNRPGGSLLSASLFRGARMRDVMDAAGVSSRASGAVITGLDGFVAFQTIEALQREESLLAYDMGTREDRLHPLPIDHGFPVRILTPGKYGYVQPKWIDSITFVDQGGYQAVLNNSIEYFDGKMQLASGFSSPRSGDTVSAGSVEMLGYAYGDARAIVKVEIRVGEGSWRPAEIVFNSLDDEWPTYLWVLWRFEWEAAPGEYNIAVRATYDDGEQQSFVKSFPYSGGTIDVMRLKVEDFG